MKQQTVWRRAWASAWVPLAAALAATGASPGESQAQGRTDTVALTGQSAPGAGMGTFSDFGLPVLNVTGQTAFSSSITGGTSTGGIYRSSSGNTLTTIALQGQSAAGAGAGTFSGFFKPLLNDTGQTAFRTSLSGGSSTRGIYRSSSGNSLTAIALQGQSAPGAGAGAFSDPFWMALNNSGQVAFDSTITGGSSSQGIYRSSSGNSLTAIALQGQSAPGTGAGTFSAFFLLVLNGAGQTAFEAYIDGGTSTRGIYRSSSDSTLTAIGLLGQSAPGAGAGTFSGFGSLVLNDTGQTAFRGTITGGNSTRAIYRSSSGNSLTAIALQGQGAPGAGAGTFSDFTFLALNDAGQTAFRGSITGGSSAEGIYRSSSSGSTLTAIALQGQSAPGAGAGTFSSFVFSVLNDAGQTAFHGTTTGGSSTQGLFLGDGRDTVAAQLQGSTLAGRTVSSLSFTSGAFNRHGQLAYRANFTDGSEGTFLFTPALRWRETFSSNWDTADRWTLGIAPASVHDVSIDPTVALTVTGPTGSVNVRSLTVGGGTGFATLNLGGGTLTSNSPVQIASRGILSGSGTIDTQVVNAGEVRADSLILSAGLVNNGTVRGMASGNQRIDTSLTNNADGVVRVDGGETLKLVGTAHSNSGSFELRGGEMQVSGRTTNSNVGRILFNGSGGIARFGGSLVNNGQVQVSFGSAEVFGAVITNGGGKIILSGNSQATFYDAMDVKSGGELRVSTGSTGVFFGLVNQRTGSLFTGTGTKFYEGGLAIGGSPGLALDSGNVNLGVGNVFTADIGGTTACTAACESDEALRNSSFDKYIVAGHLALGGTLKLASWNGFELAAGQRFDLLDWGSVSGNFDHIDATGLMLADGLLLDTSQLGLDGSVAITAVPEPQTWVLMALGLVGAALRRRDTTATQRPTEMLRRAH